MALRNQATSSNENLLGNPLLGKRGQIAGTINLQRAALGDIKNVASQSPSIKEFKQPMKPPVSRRNSDDENENVCSNLAQDEKIMDISNQAEAVVEIYEDTVDDIDINDAGNPQLVVEYVKDIYSYLRQLETEQYVKADYLAGQKEILPKMRAVLIDWLVGVHLQFNLLQETLYLTIAIFDRFLQVKVGSVSRSKLQLVGVAAMLVAAKYEEIYAPEVTDFVYITDKAYTVREILKMEVKILSTLKFELGRPLPLHFLRRASKVGGVDAATHTLAKYVVELTLGVYDMCDVPPSRISAAALALALRVFDPASSLDSVWVASLVSYTKYSLEEIRPTIEKLAAILVSAPRYKLATVYQKYSNKKFMKIARIPVLEHSVLKLIAKGERN